MLAHVAGHDKSRVQLVALSTYPPPEPLTHPGSQIMSALVDVWGRRADAIPWPGLSTNTITEPIDLGPFADAAPCRVLFLRRPARPQRLPAMPANSLTVSRCTWLNG